MFEVNEFLPFLSAVSGTLCFGSGFSKEPVYKKKVITEREKTETVLVCVNKNKNNLFNI